MIRTLALILTLATPAAAEDVVFSPQATETCLASTADPETCIGQSARLCMDQTENGYSTVNMSICTTAEITYWDDRLNAAFSALKTRHRQMDSENVALGFVAPSLLETLRDMQRAWIPYRDATCAYEQAWWGTGSGRGPAGLECELQLTGEQALELESRLLDTGR